jgi:hypothetical protein
MALQTVSTAQLQCSFGAAPSTLNVMPVNREMCENKLAANVMDHQPMVNIMPFGVCASLANPQVAAATSAALGVLTPQPCIPVTVTPWTPGSPTVPIASMPALNNTSTCNCLWAGVIAITNPGQTTVMIP